MEKVFDPMGSTPIGALEKLLSLLDDDYDSDTFARATRPAVECCPPDCAHTSPVSVFEFSDREFSLCKPMAAPRASSAVKVVTRGINGLQCLHIPFADSEEGMEKERQRRARQIVPRPTRQKGLRFKGSKNWRKIDGPRKAARRDA